MRRLLALALTVGYSIPALACVEPDTPSLRQSLDSATSVVIVRLTSLSLKDLSENSRDLAGKIETVRVLKGAPRFQVLTHQAVWCGGLHLQVGHYYLVATRESGSVLHVQRGERGIVDISEDYTQTYPPKKAAQLWQTSFIAYLAGKSLPKTFNPWPLMEPVYAFPPPPMAPSW